MSSTRWERIQGLFEAARGKPVDQRAAFLADACEDAELRTLVREMLEANEGTPLSLEASALVPAGDDEGDPQAPRTIGRFRVARVLGRGGMADVFKGVDPTGEVRGPVAIKVLKLARSTPDMIQRLRLEADILKRLEHPNIATLLESGSAADGLPYVVMTYVDGAPLLEYLQRAKATLDVRLKLFRIICAAVQHAHDARILHRDLKPANVLVNRAGHVMLLDFGIGKVLGAPEDGGPVHIVTPAGIRLLTPSHSAPEQVRGDPPTERTDVYGLGLTLYEMIAGEPAFSTRGVNWFEWERRVLEVDPPPPSEMANTATADEVVGPTPDAELDAIVMKAIRKDPQERFPSVAAFDARVGDYLKRVHRGESPSP